jgi:hypothetical protein
MTADAPHRSIRVHSDPHDEWFSTEIEAITDGLLTERNTATEDECVGSQMLALTRLAVRVVARRGEPFTAADIWQVIECREIPMPAGTTTADLEAVWRRLRRRIERANTARGNARGQV